MIKPFLTLITFLLMSCLFSADSYADKYLVEKPDGSIAIVSYNDGSRDSLENVLRDLNFIGYPISLIKDEDIPKDRSERKYWKRGVNKIIEVDSDKKQSDLNKKNQKEDEIDSVLDKLKITKEEARLLRDF